MGEEECDDRNEFDGDGCSSLCTVEDGWTCPDWFNSGACYETSGIDRDLPLTELTEEQWTALCERMVWMAGGEGARYECDYFNTVVIKSPGACVSHILSVTVEQCDVTFGDFEDCQLWRYTPGTICSRAEEPCPLASVGNCDTSYD